MDNLLKHAAEYGLSLTIAVGALLTLLLFLRGVWRLLTAALEPLTGRDGPLARWFTTSISTQEHLTHTLSALPPVLDSLKTETTAHATLTAQHMHDTSRALTHTRNLAKCNAHASAQLIQAAQHYLTHYRQQHPDAAELENAAACLASAQLYLAPPPGKKHPQPPRPGTKPA